MRGVALRLVLLFGWLRLSLLPLLGLLVSRLSLALLLLLLPLLRFGLRLRPSRGTRWLLVFLRGLSLLLRLFLAFRFFLWLLACASRDGKSQK